MRLTNRLFFEQVETMLSEGHDVQIRMKGHSMRPLLRNDRDIAVLTPIALYTGTGPGKCRTGNFPENTGNTSTPDYGIPENSVPGIGGISPHNCDTLAVTHSGCEALQPGNVVLFRCGGRHILHRIVRIETGAGHAPAGTTAATSADNTTAPEQVIRETTPAGTPIPVSTPPTGNAPAAPISIDNSTGISTTPNSLRFILAGDGNHRMEEQCAGGDIVAVMTAVIRPSGRIVRTSSRRWRRQSRCWLALPQGVRRLVLRVLWRLGIR